MSRALRRDPHVDSKLVPRVSLPDDILCLPQAARSAPVSPPAAILPQLGSFIVTTALVAATRLHVLEEFLQQVCTRPVSIGRLTQAHVCVERCASTVDRRL